MYPFLDVLAKYCRIQIIQTKQEEGIIQNVFYWNIYKTLKNKLLIDHM